MDPLKDNNHSHQGEKIQHDSFEIRKRVIAYAEVHGNRPAARHFNIDERRIREWRSKKSEIGGSLASKKGKKRCNVSGGGRKPLSTELEDTLVESIIDKQRHACGLRVSCKLIMKTAEITYREMKDDNPEHFEDFVASRGWFYETKWLIGEAKRHQSHNKIHKD